MADGCLWEILGFFFEGILEAICEALFCGCWSERNQGFDRKPKKRQP
jgi:hypothetical protein